MIIISEIKVLYLLSILLPGLHTSSECERLGTTFAHCNCKQSKLKRGYRLASYPGRLLFERPRPDLTTPSFATLIKLAPN